MWRKTKTVTKQNTKQHEIEERNPWDCKRKVIAILLLLPDLSRVQTRPSRWEVEVSLYF